MPSQDKLIKQGIRYTDSLFNEISKRIEQGVLSTDTLEAFLDKYHKAYPDNGNPLVTLGYDKEMIRLILSETNNHKFTRPAQKELVRVTIENRVGENIIDVGDEIRDSVRDIVKDGYNNRLSQDEIAENISGKVSSIKNRRARAIARTEIARAATVSDYIINKEMGATHFYVECRNTACPVCKEAWHNKWTPENDSSFSPSDTSAGGKGWIGDKTYSMNDTKMLPPLHPNCRCVPYFINDGSTPEPTAREPTKEELSNNLTASERAKYANYKRSIASHEQWLRDNPNASQKAISGHRKRLEAARQKLEELRVKAIGSVEVPVTSEPTPEPKQPKPKTTPKEPEPKAEPKPKPKPQRDPVPISEPKTPTREQLDKNLTQKERKEYKDIEYEIKWANDILNKASSTDKQKAYAKTRLDAITPRFNELTNKALGLAPKRKRKSKSSTSKKKTKKTKEPVQLDKPKNARLTKEECDSLTFEQLAEHHNATYKGIVKKDDDNKEYHIFEQKFDNGETFTLHFEKGAVNSYKKGEVATANEIIHEVFKVPETFRKETNEIWFKNTQKGIRKKPNGKFDTIGKSVGGYNTSRIRGLRSVVIKDQSTKFKGYDDPSHRIVINPKSFKKLKDFLDIITWRDTGDSITSWKHIIHHEFTHSIQDSRKIWYNGLKELHDRDDYTAIDKEENYFTRYANKMKSESFAEHGGYISYMLANPEEQSKKITIHHYDRDENNKIVSIEEKIDFEEYKQRYPKHYKYFVDLIKNGASKYETK